MYLMTMFDRGFEFPDRQWTIDQLDCRLKLIHNTLDLYKIQSSSSPIGTLDDVSNALIKLDSNIMSSTLPSHGAKSPLDKAANAFHSLKIKFIENHRNNYKWTDGICQWLNDSHNMTERKHYDILTYYLLNRSWSIIVCFTANINHTGRYMLLSIGSIVHGLYIEIPIGNYEVNSNHLDATDMYENFETELKNLIHSICQRKTEIQS